jgi:hypothetical protein
MLCLRVEKGAAGSRLSDPQRWGRSAGRADPLAGSDYGFEGFAALGVFASLE